MIPYLFLFLKGTGITVAAWLSASMLSGALGTLLGIASSRRIGSLYVQRVIHFYTFVAKGVPAYVQILIAYFVIPSLLGITIPGFIAATGALGICSSGYVTEIVRSALNSIDLGQWEACLVLGYSRSNTLWRIILPQAISRALAPLVGECEQLLKSTSLLATIGITELTRSGMNIISRELNPLPVYLSIALIYLLFSAFLQIGSRYIERRMHNG